MRVIAGTARRTVLTAPSGTDTRPTSDRAKEGLFNIIGPLIVGARFLDLFSGSGAIGIEALSRGASEAVFAEQAKPALEALRKNLASVKKEAAGRIIPAAALNAIGQLEREGREFDIVFMDPPYDKGLIEGTISGLLNSSVLTKDGLVIAETETGLPLPQADGFTLERQRDYGRTRFLFYRKGDAE